MATLSSFLLLLSTLTRPTSRHLPNDIPRTFLADSQYSEDMDIFSAEEDIAGVNNRLIWQKQQTKTKLKTQKLLFLKLRSSSELCY